ncbi:uncharacterized protein LOC105843625 isoform X2 [Hydra vulgaris]|uniref:Uncharacterized protein LOC105843625 isoform X2 n=1 Tax=Hydra vulgaris TaxID=6087 RepID=A0ABM4C0Z3_HYDVU
MQKITRTIRNKIYKKRNFQSESETKEFEDDYVEVYKEVFTIYDKNKDGQIDTQNLKSVMRCLGYNPTEGWLLDTTVKFDVDENGKISYSEFEELMNQVMEPINEEKLLIEAFHIFENHGFVSYQSLNDAIRKAFENSTFNVESLLDGNSFNMDCQLNHEEFCSLFKEIKSRFKLLQDNSSQNQINLRTCTNKEQI